mmetsp:Transcript_11659/g.41642  ORF Transcript_11659/g.41642 Transcript_11659/m.41642 type:complete len:228 (-) Transcript_11659:1196-1879(-)
MTGGVMFRLQVLARPPPPHGLPPCAHETELPGLPPLPNIPPRTTGDGVVWRLLPAPTLCATKGGVMLRLLPAQTLCATGGGVILRLLPAPALCTTGGGVMLRLRAPTSGSTDAPPPVTRKAEVALSPTPTTAPTMCTTGGGVVLRPRMTRPLSHQVLFLGTRATEPEWLLRLQAPGWRVGVKLCRTSCDQAGNVRVNESSPRDLSEAAPTSFRGVDASAGGIVQLNA